MVREVRQPSLITPQRPRVSSSATTTASRYPRPAPAVSSTIKVTKVPIVGTGKSRVVLGERQDNVPAVPPRAGSVRKDTVKEGRISLGSPSRPTPRATASSPVLEIVHQIIDFRPRASPLPPSPAIGCLHLNDDETMLLDMRPAEMSSVMTETDDSGDEEPAPMKPSGRLMTPADSQEVSVSVPLLRAVWWLTTFQAGSLHRFVQPPPSSQRHPISRLPTPPSSQAQSDQEHTVSQASSSRIRPRPSLTPPRWTSTAPSILLSASQDPSPNPRSKKTPRIESAASVPPPGRLRSPFGLQHRRDVSISPQIQGKGKSRSPPATLSVSAKLNRSVSQGVSSSSTSRTPLPPQTRSIPSTAPPATRRPRISGISRSATPKTVQSKPLSRHQTPLASARFRRSLTPSARKVLSGVRVGFLEKEIEASPGDDPLLLKGPEVDEVERQWPKVESWKTGLGLELGPLPMTAAMSSPRRSRSAPPVTAAPVPVDDKDLRLDHSGIQDDQYDPGQTWASDDDTDVEDTGDPRDDTFLHVLGRRIVHTQPLSPARHISETIAPPVRLDEPIGSRPRVDGGSSSQTPRSHDPDRISLMLEEARTRLGSTMKELAAESDDEPERSPEQSAAEADGADPAAYPGDHIADERSASLAPHAASDAFDEEHEGDATREAEDGEWDIAVAKSSNKCSASPGFKQIPKDASHSPSPETTHRSAQHEEKVDRSAEEGKESTGTPDAEKSQADHTGDISIEAESDDWSLSEPSGERSIVEAHQGQPGSLQDSEYMSDEKSDQSDGDQSSSEDEDHEEPLPAESGEKIVIRVINRGVVKIEDEQVAVCLGLPNELPVHASLRELPSTSLYPSLSTLPTLPTEPVLSQPLPSPSPPIALTSEHAQPRVQRYGNASAIEAMLGPRNSSSSSSVRPPSRLSQEVTTASTEDGPSRSRMSLRDELAFAIATERDNEGDESMRSVVEVSSLDPRAAARAAAILKLVSPHFHSPSSGADLARIMRTSSTVSSLPPLTQHPSHFHLINLAGFNLGSSTRHISTLSRQSAS